MGSDNLDGADNQQERLIQLGWVVGFVDGEGCFSIGFVRQQGGGGRSGYRTGYQVAHEFAVTQGESSLDALRDLERFFGVGMWCRTGGLMTTVSTCIATWFGDGWISWNGSSRSSRSIRSGPPSRRTSRSSLRCVSLISDGRHRTFDGLIRIAEIAETMNSRKPRTELIRILRDHTPDVRDIG